MPGNRIPAVTLYADTTEIKTAFQIATNAHVCLQCKQTFSLLESLGALNCEQHPGFLQENGKWSCCGQQLHTPRWSGTRPFLNMYDCKQQPFECATVRGCQKCDHNTSNKPYTNKDSHSLAELSALLPFLNKEYPFVLRPGFEEGVLRRCAPRKITIPVRAVTIKYQDIHGNIVEYDVQSGKPRPDGIEISAIDENGNQIHEWRS